MQEVMLKDNFKCKYPNSDPVHGECEWNAKGLCDTACHNYGVCGTCFHFSISGKSNECFECHFNESIKRDPNIIIKDDKGENDLIKAVKEKDGYINGNDIKL